MIFTAYKVVSALPTVLVPNAIYLVRVGNGFDLYCSDATGNIAHPINTITTVSNPNPQFVTATTVANIDASVSNVWFVAVPNNCTLNRPTNLQVGQQLTIILQVTGQFTNNRVVALDPVYKLSALNSLTLKQDEAYVLTCFWSGQLLYIATVRKMTA